MATYGGGQKISAAVSGTASMVSSNAEQQAYYCGAGKYAIVQIKAVLDANGVLKINGQIYAANETAQLFGVYIGPGQNVTIDNNDVGVTTSSVIVTGVEFENNF